MLQEAAVSAAKEEDKETKRRRTTTESSHRTKPVSACAFVLLHSWHLAKQHPPLGPFHPLQQTSFSYLLWFFGRVFLIAVVHEILLLYFCSFTRTNVQEDGGKRKERDSMMPKTAKTSFKAPSKVRFSVW